MLKDLPKDEMPREKMIKYGPNHLSNSELLAIILRTGTKEKSALAIGCDLVKSKETVQEISGMTVEELCAFEGIGESKACQIIAAIELGKRVHTSDIKRKVKLTSPHEVVAFFTTELKGAQVEKFICVFLNTKNEIITWEVISVGSLNASIVHPREVFNRAIKRSAASILVLHNHPSGHVTPSQEDLLITERLAEVGKITGIPLLDHLIIGHEDYYSFKEENKL